MVDLACLAIVALKLQADHVGELAGQGVADDRDHTDGSAGYHRERQRVVATDHLEALGLVLDDLVDLLQAARGFLDAHDVGEVLGDAARRGRLHVHSRAPRHVVEHQGQRTGLGDGLEVLVQALLRRLVVVRTDAQDAVDTLPVAGLHLLDDGPRVVAATVFEQGHAALHHALDDPGDLVFLAPRQAGRLARCGQDAQEVGTIVQLIVDESLQSLEIDAHVALERSDQRNSQSSENITHIVVCSCVSSPLSGGRNWVKDAMF